MLIFLRFLAMIQEIEKLQQRLDDLKIDGASVETVYHSLRNAYIVIPNATKEDIDMEINRAYDDLMAQVRKLDRSLKKLSLSMNVIQHSVPYN